MPMHGYLTKPVQFDAFEALVKSINDFRLTKVELPPQLSNAERDRGWNAEALPKKATAAVCCAKENGENQLRNRPMALQILLVEDSPGDVRLTQEAFRDANRSIHLHVAADGVEAMAFLKHEGAHVACPSPGSDPAGSEPSQNGWPRSSGPHQGG